MVYVNDVTGHTIDPAGRPYDPERLPRKPDAGADAYFALDIRAGRVVAVEPLPDARTPSYVVEVDFGPAVGVMKTSAQITNYTEGELLGRMVVGAINLGPKRVAGFKSEFLVLGALDPDGTVRLLQLEDGVEPGAPIA